MDRKWLLLFKGNIYTLTGQVQRTLFEQTAATVSELEELRLLSAEAAGRVAGSVFLWAANHPRCFAHLSEEQIAVRLQELAKLRAMDKPRQAAPRTGEPDSAVLTQKLPEVWEALSKRIRIRNLLRRLTLRAGTVGFMAAALITGGFLSGMVTPPALSTGTQPSPASGRAPSAVTSAANIQDGVDVKLKELNVQQHELPRYADFKMEVPAYLPPGYTFDEGIAWLPEGQTKTDHTMLVYSNAQKHLLRVSYYKLAKISSLSTGSFMPETRKELYIRGTKALFSTNESGLARLDWMEDNIFISISGRELEETELVNMAESLK